MATIDDIFAAYGVPKPTNAATTGTARYLALANQKQPQTKGKVTGRSNQYGSALISEGGSAAGALAGAGLGTAILPGIGTVIGAGLGGFLGGTAGRGLENKIRDDQEFLGAGGSAKAALTEGAISGVLSGAGAGFQALKAAKAAKAAPGLAQAISNAPVAATGISNVSQATGIKWLPKGLHGGGISAPKEAYTSAVKMINGTSGLSSTAKQTLISGLQQDMVTKGYAVPKVANAAVGLTDDVVRVGAESADDVSKAAAKTATSLRSRGIGALDLKEELRALPNAAERVATAQQYGIQSGRKGLTQATAQMAKFENQLKPLLGKTKVSAKTVTDMLDDVAKTTSADINEGTLARIIAREKATILRQAQNGYVGGDTIRSLRSRLGDGLFKGAETERKALEKEIYFRMGDVIGKANPEARAILGEQHKILDLGSGLAARSEAVGVPMPFVGGRVKVPGVAAIRDRGIDALAGVQGAVGGAVGAVPEGIRGGVKALAGQAALQYPGKLFQAMGVEQTPQGVEEFSEGELTMPGVPPQNAPESFDPYPLANAIADIQRDPKNTKQYMDYYNFISKATETKGGAKLGAAQQKQLSTLSTAERQISELEKIYSRAGGPQGRILGTAASLRGKALGGQEGAYEQVRQSAVAQIARALGEVGVLTDQDIKRALGAIPKFSDTPDEVQTKLQYIRSILGGAREAVSGNTEEPDFEETLQQSQLAGLI